MPSLRSVALVSAATAVSAWGEAGGKAGGSPLDLVVNPVKDVLGAAQGLGTDVVGYLLATPQAGADFICWAIGILRSLPSLGMSIWNGNEDTQNMLAAFCVSCATSCFIVYAAVAALNFLLVTTCTVKDYFTGYMTIANWGCCGIKMPKAIADALAPIQTHVLDRIKNWKVSYVVPLEGHKGKVNIGVLASSTAAAISLCMLLGSVPAVLALVRGGADKAAAEALAWTCGTALGVQFLVAKNAN